MTDLDLKALHDARLDDALLEEASHRPWHPMHGPAMLMRDMQMSHLVRSLRFIRRNLETVLAEQEETLTYAQGKWCPSEGFTGFEDRIAFRSAVLDALILEVHRRLRHALAAGRSISAETAVHLKPADLIRPDPKQVQLGIELNFTPEPALPDEHPQDRLPF